MKTNLSKMLRSGLALLLAFSLVIGYVPASVFASLNGSENPDATGKPANNNGIVNYVALGASNTNGYGLTGYLSAAVQEDPLAASKANMNVYGYNRAPEGGYPYQIGYELNKLIGGTVIDGYEGDLEAAQPFTNVNLSQLAISSMRVEEARYLLDDSMEPDEYMDWRFTGGQKWFEIAEPGGLDKLKEAYREALAEANYVTVDIGWNNFGVYAFNNIKTIMADGTYWKAPVISDVMDEDNYNEIKAAVLAKLEANMSGASEGLKEKLVLMADVLTYATLGACTNYDIVMEKIYEMNPDVNAVVINIQNLADDLVVEFEGEELKLGDIYGELIDLVNLYRASESPYADKIIFADAGDVTTFLDELIAWNGDPATLSDDMVDCFDMYDDNLYVRSIVEYLMVGQAMSGLFQGFRDTCVQYQLGKIDAQTGYVGPFGDDDKYTYEFALTRTPEELLALNLGALDLNNPAGADKDVEEYGKALSAHLKNLRGEAPNIAAYDYIFDGVLASLEARKGEVVEGVAQLFARLNQAVSTLMGVNPGYNVDDYYKVLSDNADAKLDSAVAKADFAAKFYADYNNGNAQFKAYLNNEQIVGVAMGNADITGGLAAAAAGYASIVEGIDVIVPGAKAEFANKLQGIYTTYHNTLNHAYDVVATFMQYAANINKLVVNTDSLNGFNTAAAGMINIVANDFINGAQAKFYYELEKNGVQTTNAPAVPKYELDESVFADPALRAIAVLAVRYELGNSFFAHPNSAGCDEITNAVMEALSNGSDADDFTDVKLTLYTEILKNNYPELYAMIAGADKLAEMDDLAIVINMLKLSGNPALAGMDLDALEAEIRAAHRDYAASKTPEEVAEAQALIRDLLERLFNLAAYITGSVYQPTEDSFYVSLGDSTMTGYGFDGYIDNLQNGWHQNVDGSAHILLAQQLYGDNWEAHFANYCLGALRAEDLLFLLGGEVVCDEYFEQEIAATIAEIEQFEDLGDARKQFVETVQKADLISVAIGGGNILTFVGKQMNRVMDPGKYGQPLKLDWSKVGIDENGESMKELNEALDILVPVIDELGLLEQYIPAEMGKIENPAKLVRALAEALLYGYAGYNQYYSLVLEKIKEINPDAQLLVMGMFNPVDDWNMTVEIDGEQVLIDIGGATGNLMGLANLQSLAFALQNKNTSFVDISDAETHLEADNPGKVLGFGDYFTNSFKTNGKAVHASEAGHKYIAKQMSNALRGGIEGALLDTYTYVTDLAAKIGEILNNNFAGVVADLKGDLNALYAELAYKTSELNAQLQKLTNEERAVLQEMMAERDALVEQLEGLNAQLEAMAGGKKARTVANTDSADELIAQLQEDIAETEAAIAALDASIAALNAKIAADLEGVAEIQAAIASTEAQINGLLAAVAKMEPGVQKLNADLKVLYKASLVLADAINNVNNLTFDKIDILAVVDAVTAVYELAPAAVEQMESIYNQTKAAAAYAKAAAEALKVAADSVQTTVNEMVSGAEKLVGIEAEKLNKIQAAVADCQKAVKAFVNDNYGAVETALINTYNDLLALAVGEIAKVKAVLEENQSLFLGVAAGAALALQEAGYIKIEGDDISLTPASRQIIMQYMQMLFEKLAELNEDVQTAKQWLQDNYPVARAELDNKLAALRAELQKVEAQLREEYNPEKLAELKIECEELKKLIAEVTAMQDKLDAYAQNVLNYIATVEATIAEVQVALDAVIEAGAVVGSDLVALWNKLVALTPVLDELAKTVGSLGCEIINELGEIFAYCGIIADKFVAVLQTLPAYVDTLRDAVKLAVETWRTLVQTAGKVADKVREELCEKLDALKKTVQDEARAVIAQIESMLETLKALLAKADGLSEDVLNKINAAIERVEKALDALKEIINGQFDSIYDMLDALADAQANLLDALNNLVKVLKADAESIYNQMVHQINVVIDLVNKWIKAGETLVENLGNWIMDTADAVQKHVVEKYNQLIQQINRELDALIKMINDELKTATGEAKEALQNLLQAALDLKNGLIQLVQGNIYNAIAMIQNAYNDLVDAMKNGAQYLSSEINNQLMILVNSLGEKIDELVQGVNETVKNLLGEAHDALYQRVLDALSDEYTVTDDSSYVAITGNGNAYVDLLAKALWLKDEQYSHMTWDALDYEALMKADLITVGYDENDLDGFAVEQLLGYMRAYIDVELRGSANAYANGVTEALLAAVPFLKPDAFAGVVGSVNVTIDQLLANELLANRQMEEMDWAALVGEENLPYVEQVLEKVEAQMITMGIPEYYEVQIDVVDFLFENAAAMGIENVLSMLDREALKVTLGEYAIYTVQVPVREALLFAAESYLYSNLEFQKNYAETMLMLYKINPDATVIVLGNYNAFREVALSIGDVSLDLGEAYETIAKATSVHPFAYALLMPNVTYVDILDTQTNYEYYVAAGYVENTFANFLSAYMSDATITQASPIGNEYIKDQILGALTVTCDHSYTGSCLDEACARCGVVKEGAGHNWGEWYTTEPATNDKEGEERRDCLNSGCGHYETREIPKIERVDPEYTVPTGLTATYGDTLADIALPEGFTWKDATASVGNAGTNSFIAVFTPADTIHYNTVEVEVQVTVAKAEPTYTAPTGLTATYGDTLADVVLPEGFTWKDAAATVGNAGTNSFTVVYTPADTDNFETVEFTVEVEVAKAEPSGVTAPTGLTATYGDTLADIALPEGFAWKDATATVGNAGKNSFTVVYTPADTDNYETVEFTVEVEVSKADSAAATQPPAAAGTLIANGTAQALVQAGTATGGTLVYSLSENGPFSAELPTATNAGTYTVYYKIQGDANHNDTQVQSLTVTIYPDKITSGEYRVEESTHIRTIAAGKTVAQLLNGINEKAYVTVFNADGTVADNDALAATGMVAKLMVNGQVIDTVTVVVTGDVNGDGKITITDMTAVKYHVLEKTALTGVYLIAADASNDGKVSITDVTQIKYHVLEKTSVEAN